MTGKTTDEETFYSTRHVAKMFHMTTETIRNWIKEGKIEGSLINGRWYIKRSEMIRFANDRHGE